jgi:CrcB protein
MLKNALLVAAGGAAGSLSRYALAAWAARIFKGTLGAGTLAVNLIGCFLIGLCAGWLARGLFSPGTSQALRLLVITGFLGGLTTFSAFSLDAVDLAGGGARPWLFAYLALSVGGGAALAWLGLRIMAARAA